MAADEDEAKGAARQRPPVTIDLAAEDVRAKSAAAEPAKDERPSEPRSGRRSDTPPPNATFSGAARALSGDESWRQAALAGLAGAIIALLVVVLLQAVGIWPAPGRGAANQALEQSKATADTATALDRRLAAVESMTETLPALRADLKAVGDKITSLDAIRNSIASRGDLEALSASIAALGKRIDALPPAVTRDDLAALTERVARLEVGAAAGMGAAPEAMTALGAQLADSETQLKALADRVAAAEAKAAAAPVISGGGEAVTRGLAVAALRRGAQGSMPFADDVDMVAALGLAGDDIAALRPYAAKGVTDAGALAAQFPAVADAILAATSASDANSGFWQRMFSSLVTIRPAGPVAGSDPPAIVSRMKDDVAKGDLVAALAERDALPVAGKDASAAWAAKAADRIALDGLIDKVARTLDPPKAG